MKIKLGFFSVLLFVTLLFSDIYFTLSAFLAVALHELGHIFAARLLKIRLSECSIGIYGAGLVPSDCSFSYKDEIFLSVAGPFMNLISFIVAGFIYTYSKNQFILYFAASSLSLGILNILPIKTFDGGRILHSILCIMFEPSIAKKALEIVSFLFVFILWCLSVYLLIIANSGLSLFVFSLSLFSRFFIKEK